MGPVRKITKRIAERVARMVAKNELFEQPGERPQQAPLQQSAPSKADDPPPADDEPPSKPDVRPDDDTAALSETVSSSPVTQRAVPFSEPAECTIADIPRVQHVLGEASHIRIVNHWATWCVPCVDEFPLLVELHTALGRDVEFFGISWDLFDPRGDAEEISEHVQNFAQGHGIAYPSLLVAPEVKSEDFIRALEMTHDKIPQTWVVDASGAVLHRVEGPLDAAGAQALRNLVEGLI